MMPGLNNEPNRRVNICSRRDGAEIDSLKIQVLPSNPKQSKGVEVQKVDYGSAE